MSFQPHFTERCRPVHAAHAATNSTVVLVFYKANKQRCGVHDLQNDAPIYWAFSYVIDCFFAVFLAGSLGLMSISF